MNKSTRGALTASTSWARPTEPKHPSKLVFRLPPTVRYFHWDKPHHGDRGNITALDLSTGKVVWEVSAGKGVNFVQEAGAGIVIGNDDGEVVLLDRTNGKAIWRCRLERKAEIKTLLAETNEGFFVSSGDSLFWLVSRDGKLLLRCHDTCTTLR